jgi:parvulin-like peptidyl-prolyl isomerase
MPRHLRFKVTSWALLAAAACSGGGDDGAEGRTSLQTYPAPPTLSEGSVIAEVGPVAFTTREIERRLRAESPYVREQLRDPEQLKTWVENEIRLEALAQKAWAEGLHEDEEVLSAIRELLVETYTRRRMKEEVESAEPSQAELIEAYKARDREFNRPAKVRLSQIVRYVDTEAEREKARALLEKILADVIEGQKKNDYTRFNAAAREHSEDEATKLGGGDLQFLTREQLAERYGQEVADASFDDAKVGDLYIADAPNAVVLFKKTGRRRAVERSLEEVRPLLRNQLVQKKRKRAFEAWSQEVMSRMGVAIDEAALAEVEIPAREPPTPAVGED